MRRLRATLATLAALALLAALAPAAGARGVPSIASKRLWATVNVCDSAGHPDAIGIRGSMPGTGDKREEMFMRFQVQYQRSDGTWRYLRSGGDSGFMDTGRARGRGSRQAGHSFRVTPPPAGNVYTFRGLVTFEWRAKDGSVVRRTRKRTTGGHRSTAGADPAGFSAAECAVTA